MFLPSRPYLPGLVDGDLQALYRDGVLGTDIDIALVCADGIAGNGHGFDDDMGVALQNGTVHERAGVALVGVAADVFLIRLVVRPQSVHFTAGREAAAAASAQAGILDDSG